MKKWKASLRPCVCQDKLGRAAVTDGTTKSSRRGVGLLVTITRRPGWRRSVFTPASPMISVSAEERCGRHYITRTLCASVICCFHVHLFWPQPVIWPNFQGGKEAKPRNWELTMHVILIVQRKAFNGKVFKMYILLLKHLNELR